MEKFPFTLEETEKFYQAGLLKAQGEYQQALAIMQSLLNLHPDFAPLHNNIGSLYFSQQNWEQACHHFENATILLPYYQEAHYNWGLSYLRLNNLGKAMLIFQRLIAFAPTHGPAQFKLGCLLMQQQDYSKAISHFHAIESLYEHHVETQINLATCYLQLGNFLKSTQYYQQALLLNPDDTQVLFNLGSLALKQGQLEKSIYFFTEVIKRDPLSFEAHHNLGFAYLTVKEISSARIHYQHALRLQPHNQALSHTLAILNQEKDLATSPPEYIRALFDSYAGHFEAHLTNTLQYQTPQLMLNLFEDNFRLAKINILDLGCGTGLSGLKFKKYASFLTGIDLSANMLKQAAEKNIYNELIESEFSTFLSTQKNKFDLIIACDALVYIGDLAALFKNAFEALKPEGVFLFNTEINKTEDYQLTASGRFSHGKNYLDHLANVNGFYLQDCRTLALRMQNNLPTLGYLYALKKLKN